MSVVLYTPYGRAEATEAALGLAAHLTALGRPVKVVAAAGGRTKVSAGWDAKVRSAGPGLRGLADSCRRATHVVYFTYDPHALAVARGAAPTARQVLVLDWLARPPKAAALVCYSKVVCPSYSAYCGAKRGGVDEGLLEWCRWPAGVTPVHRHPLLAAGRVSALVLWDARPPGPVSAGAVAMALASAHDRHPHLSLTLAVAGRYDRGRVARWAARLGLDRAEVVGWSDLAGRDRLFHAHDWVVLPAPAAAYGLTAAAALARGCAVVCGDVAPYAEYVSPGKGGVLAGGGAYELPTRLKPAVSTAGRGDWDRAFDEAFARPKAVHAARAEAPDFAGWAKGFARCWAKVLGGVTMETRLYDRNG